RRFECNEGAAGLHTVAVSSGVGAADTQLLASRSPAHLALSTLCFSFHSFSSFFFFAFTLLLHSLSILSPLIYLPLSSGSFMTLNFPPPLPSLSLSLSL